MDILGVIGKIRRWARGEQRRYLDNLKFAHDDRLRQDAERQAADYGQILEWLKQKEEEAKRKL